ncbi:STAS domain-containing protein [Streptomyces sp. NPDC048383]|uniref:STAS domain-containing protein n=1 Tax=Streptomyces sp. NPDC048383 TaxID=3155386 RepID=UPI0034309EBD
MGQEVEVAPDADGVRLIVCTGVFEYETLGLLRDAGAAAAADPTVRQIALDLTGVTHADSSMLSELLFMQRTGRLYLVGHVPQALDRLFDLTGVRELFPLIRQGVVARAV